MRLLALTIATIGFASAATAQTMVEDTDGDGMYSMEELLTVFTTLTEDTFVQIDTDADGAVSAEELAAAEASGMITAG